MRFKHYCQHNVLLIKIEETLIFQRITAEMLNFTNKKAKEKMNVFSAISFYIVLSCVQPKHGSQFSSLIHLLLHNALHVIMKLTWYIDSSQKKMVRKKK